jgi:hypothetical protein
VARILRRGPQNKKEEVVSGDKIEPNVRHLCSRILERTKLANFGKRN